MRRMFDQMWWTFMRYEKRLLKNFCNFHQGKWTKRKLGLLSELESIRSWRTLFLFLVFVCRQPLNRFLDSWVYVFWLFGLRLFRWCQCRLFDSPFFISTCCWLLKRFSWSWCSANAKTGEAKPAVGEKLASKPPAKRGEYKPDVGEIVVPEPPTKPREAKPAAGEKVAQKPSAKPGEAKPAVGEKLAQKPPAKSGEAKPAVGEIVVPKPLVKTGEAKQAAGEKLTSKPPARSGEDKPDVADEHAS